MRATHRTSDVDVSPNFRVPSSRRSFGTLSRSDGYPRRSRIAMRNAHRKWSRASLQLREGQTIGAVTIGPFPTFGLLHQRSSKVFETQKSKVKHGVFFALFFCVATAAVAFVGIKTASHMHMGASRARSVASSRISSFNTQATTSSLGSPQSTINVAVITEVDANQVLSHFGPPWEDVLLHIKRRLSWLDYDINLIAVSAEKVINDPKTVLHNIPMAIAIGIKNKAVAEKLARATSSVSTLVSYDSAPSLHAATRMNAHSLHSDSTWEVLKRIFRPKEFAELEKYRAAVNMATDLFERRTSDDFLFSFLVLINEAIRPIPDVTNSTKRQDAGVPELKCMIGHCSREIFACLADSTCRTALSCLNSCGFNDQVCTYRCIASYESPALESFSLCILQKHNCLNLDVDIPKVPDPEPMTSFRGEPLTHQVAESLFVGWFGETDQSVLKGKLPFSWRVFAGKNPAYDYFPCQYQLFYPGKAKDTLWYQPVFKVQTLPKGEEVWRDRLYRVRRGKSPGRFDFSVLDNGVTSKEKWSILDCDDSLDWCAFYYNGAAARAGLRYNGAVLVSKTGQWPEDAQAKSRLVKALKRAGIEMWELSTVNNDNCQDAPLTPLRDVAWMR